MVKNGAVLQKFERELIRRRKPDIAGNFRLVESLRKEARALGMLPCADPLSGIEIDIKAVKVVNSVPKAT